MSINPGVNRQQPWLRVITERECTLETFQENIIAPSETPASLLQSRRVFVSEGMLAFIG
jgi:hypothetical protein